MIPDFLDLLEELRSPGVGLQMGLPPGRIDILTDLPGVQFREAWSQRLDASFFGRVGCPVIGLEDLLKNKRTVGRLQDLADVEALEERRAEAQ